MNLRAIPDVKWLVKKVDWCSTESTERPGEAIKMMHRIGNFVVIPSKLLMACCGHSLDANVSKAWIGQWTKRINIHVTWERDRWKNGEGFDIQKSKCHGKYQFIRIEMKETCVFE